MPSDLPDYFEERRSRSQFVDPTTLASNPGDFRVQWGQFFRAFAQPARGLAIVAIILLTAVVHWHWLWALPLIGVVGLAWVAVRRVKDHFAFGNTLPGVIVSQKPPLVAVITDLSKGIGQYNAVKVLEQPLSACELGGAPIGTRVPTVALYQGLHDEWPHWDDFFPVLVAAATRDPRARVSAMERLEESDWRELEEALATLPSPPVAGLYPLGWTLPEEAPSQVT